jgi:hypothetical protein
MTKITSSLSISTLLGLSLLVAPGQPAQAAVGDPELILYRFAGVTDNGGAANQGVAIVFHCTNFSGVTEIIRFVTRVKPARFSVMLLFLSPTLSPSRRPRTVLLYSRTLV